MFKYVTSGGYLHSGDHTEDSRQGDLFPELVNQGAESSIDPAFSN